MVNDKKKVAIGVGVIAAILALLFFWKRAGAAPECAEGTTQCVGVDLYTCVNGKWELTEANSLACGYVPPIDVSVFGFTEIVENHLPEYIIGWAEATCSGHYNYVPPAGYERTSCGYDSPNILGSHGGCPNCIMCKVRCDRIS